MVITLGIRALDGQKRGASEIGGLAETLACPSLFFRQVSRFGQAAVIIVGGAYNANFY